MYSYALELAWDPKPSNMTGWIENYSLQRYGQNNANTKKAWVLLLQNVYQGGPLGGSSPITYLPAIIPPKKDFQNQNNTLITIYR
eukprot:UN19548